MRVLLIEDDPMIGRAVVAGLQDAGYTVDWVRDGAEAELALGHRVYDLTLLDLGLPRRDGVELLKGLRRDGSSLPVVIITARDALADRVAGLDLGADDYLVKPFDLDELSARMRAVVRRKAGRAESTLKIGALEIDTAARRVKWKGKEVAISAREYALLEALANRPGSYLTRAQLEERLYGWDDEIASNAVEVHIHALRRKLDPAFIRTVRGLGYSLVRE